MTDRETPLAVLRQWIQEFVDARDWHQFHTPKNLSMALAVEAAELLEHFQWLAPDASRAVAYEPDKLAKVAEELADVVCYALALANELSLDVTTAVRDKMAKNAEKYPADEYRGRYGPEDPGKPAERGA